MSDRPAKRDYAHLHLALARRALGLTVKLPDLDGPVPMFDDDNQAIEEAKARHPARPVRTVQSEVL